MTYYINPIWFYLINISTNLKTIFIILSFCLIFCAFISFFVWGVDEAFDKISKTKKISARFMIFAIITLILSVATPNKETCIEMMAASVVTHENVHAVKEEIYDIVDYITDKINGDK